MVEFTYHSNAIEGNTLTLRETDMVLRGPTIDKKPLKDHLEAIGHKEAFLFVCDLVKEKERRNELRSSGDTGKGKYSGKYVFSGMIICGSCGESCTA